MKIDPRWWIGILALSFGANYAFNNCFLPFSGMPGLGIQFRLGDENPRIFKVDPTSPAGLAGIAPGDLIVGVDGRGILSINDYFLQEQLLGGDARFQLTIKRAGQRKIVDVFWKGSYFHSLSPINQD